MQFPLPKQIWYVLITLVFLTTCIFVGYEFHFYYSPDAISYLAVSEKIISGNFYSSVNAYWSPLVSWLLIPFLLLLKDGILCFQLLNCCCAAIVLYNCNRIFQHYGKNSLVWQFILLGLSFLLPVLALLHLTADFLFLAIVLQYFYWQIQHKIGNSAVLFCISGLLLFWSKTYGLYFFLLHNLVLLAYKFFTKKPIALKPVIKGLLYLIICSGVWISILSYKYGRFTISTAAIYNQSIIKANGTIVHPCDTMKLIAPFSNELYTAWEEMSLHTQTQLANNPKKEWGIHLLKINLSNTFTYYNKLPRYGMYFLLLLLAIVYFFRISPKNIFLPVSSLLIYSAGYLFYFIEDRYLFFGSLLLILLLLVFTNQLLQKFTKLTIPLALLFLYIVVRPGIDIIRHTNTTDEYNSAVIAKFAQTETRKNIHFATAAPYQYATIAYACKWKNYGGIAAYRQDSVLLEKDLNSSQIHYLIVPDTFRLPMNLQNIYTLQPLPEGKNIFLWKRKE